VDVVDIYVADLGVDGRLRASAVGEGFPEIAEAVGLAWENPATAWSATPGWPLRVVTTLSARRVRVLANGRGHSFSTAEKVPETSTVGVERGTDFDVVDPLANEVPGEDGGTDGLLTIALKARPDLLSLVRQIDAQELTTGSIKGSYAPPMFPDVRCQCLEGSSVGRAGAGVRIVV
jgi:hypothetical protein